MADAEMERRITAEDTKVEYREMDGGEKRPVIVGYAAVFQSPSHDLGGFIETIHPRAFDDVLKTNPDVVGVFNHDKNMLLARSSNGSLRLKADPYGLRYEMTPPKTKTAEEVVALVSEGYVTGSSFAFAVSRSGGDSWSTDANGVRRREIRSISLLDDVGPVVRPAYGASSVVVSRRAIELALGDAFRPNQTMANAARRVLRSSKVAGVDQRLLAVAERIAERSVLSVEEVEFLAETHRKCHDVRSIGWKHTQAWVEWMLAGGDSGEAWVAKRAAEPQPVEIANRAAPNELRVGDFVSWNSSGGRARGKIERVVRDGTIDVPDSSFSVSGEADDPAALIRVYRRGADGWAETDRMVGHKFSTLTKIEALEGRAEPGELSEGDFVMWAGEVGRVEHIMLTGSIQGMTATEDAPLAVVTPYDDGEPEDYMVAVAVSMLTKADEPMPEGDDEMESDDEERAVSLRPSAGMASAARRGLRLHEEGKSGDGLKPETVARANKIARREELTADHVREMNAWFARHESASKSPGWDTPGAEKPGFVAWLLWSGDAGKAWSARKVAQMERESERSEAAVAEEAVAATVTEQPEEATAAPEPVAVSADTTQFDAEMAQAAAKLADLQAALLRIKLHDAT